MWYTHLLYGNLNWKIKWCQLDEYELPVIPQLFIRTAWKHTSKENPYIKESTWIVWNNFHTLNKARKILHWSVFCYITVMICNFLQHSCPLHYNKINKSFHQLQPRLKKWQLPWNNCNCGSQDYCFRWAVITGVVKEWNWDFSNAKKDHSFQ